MRYNMSTDIGNLWLKWWKKTDPITQIPPTTCLHKSCLRSSLRDTSALCVGFPAATLAFLAALATVVSSVWAPILILVALNGLPEFF